MILVFTLSKNEVFIRNKLHKSWSILIVVEPTTRVNNTVWIADMNMFKSNIDALFPGKYASSSINR